MTIRKEFTFKFPNKHRLDLAVRVFVSPYATITSFEGQNREIKITEGKGFKISGCNSTFEASISASPELISAFRLHARSFEGLELKTGRRLS